MSWSSGSVRPNISYSGACQPATMFRPILPAEVVGRRELLRRDDRMVERGVDGAEHADPLGLGEEAGRPHERVEGAAVEVGVGAPVRPAGDREQEVDARLVRDPGEPEIVVPGRVPPFRCGRDRESRFGVGENKPSWNPMPTPFRPAAFGIARPVSEVPGVRGNGRNQPGHTGIAPSANRSKGPGPSGRRPSTVAYTIARAWSRRRSRARVANSCTVSARWAPQESRPPSSGTPAASSRT